MAAAASKVPKRNEMLSAALLFIATLLRRRWIHIRARFPSTGLRRSTAVYNSSQDFTLLLGQALGKEGAADCVKIGLAPKCFITGAAPCA